MQDCDNDDLYSQLTCLCNVKAAVGGNISRRLGLIAEQVKLGSRSSRFRLGAAGAELTDQTGASPLLARREFEIPGGTHVNAKRFDRSFLIDLTSVGSLSTAAPTSAS